MLVLAVSLALAALLGFAAHRASICTVKAVAEVLSKRRANMLLSFLKTLLWVELVALWIGWLRPGQMPGLHWPLSQSALIGGAIFGIGASFNQGCSFSTISRLAEGQLRMLATIIGLALGAVLYIYIVRYEMVPMADASSPSTGMPEA
ncbi:MAG: YeeE/YedE thiosulfate transporter family protein, partial [Planctomycetota bacterium]